MADIIFHDECQLLSYGESRREGKWIKLRLSDTEGDPLVPFRGLDKDGSKHSPILHITVAIGDIIAAPEPEAKPAGYGQYAQILYKSQFFTTPDVWRAVGTDEEFLLWLRCQECAVVEDRDGGCGGDVVAAHVRRVADGAGMGIKPPYSAIPLCSAHHQLQHQSGESVIGSKEWFDRTKIHYLRAWCWSALKAHLGYLSWADVPPGVLYEWAVKNHVSMHIPNGYLP